jgi:hypothetical protein
MTDEDLEAIQSAVRLLEHTSLAARLTQVVGKPIELIGHAVPQAAADAIAAATTTALNAALKAALASCTRRWLPPRARSAAASAW